MSIGFGQKPGELPKLFVSSCDLSGYRTAAPASSAGPPELTARLPSGLPAAMVAVRGDTGPPEISLAAPGGSAVAMTSGSTRVRPGAALKFSDAASKTTFVLLARPRGGRYRVRRSGGSSAVSSVRVANALPKPAVRVKVTGKGRKRVLRWRVRRIRGQTVKLYEYGRDVRRALITIRSARGRRSFRPAPGRSRARRIVAVVQQAGLPRDVLSVARYRAPFSGPARPGRITVRRTGQTIRLRWRRARGARLYRGTVTVGRRKLKFLSRSPRFTLTGIPTSSRGSVALRSLDRLDRLSKPRRAQIRLTRRKKAAVNR